MSQGGQPVFRSPIPPRLNPKQRAIKALAVKVLVSIGQRTIEALAVEVLVHIQGALSRASLGGPAERKRGEQFNSLPRK